MDYATAIIGLRAGRFAAIRRPHWTTCVLKADEWGNDYFAFNGGGQSKYFPIRDDWEATDWIAA